MPRVVKTPLFTAQQAVDGLRRAVHSNAGNFFAMYSSRIEGIVTDPALMLIPLDDHMVHRGHGIFDTATLIDGRLYQLDDHLQRFYDSAKLARIPLPFNPERIRQIILDTAAASRHRDGSVRYWLSAGPGGFGLDSSECIASAFYVMIFRQAGYPDWYYTEGIKVVTSSVPIKAPFFARIKSTNYLPNALVVLDATDRGAQNGIFIDRQGMIGEGSNMNVAFVDKDLILRHPSFDSILTGITVRRMAQLARRLVQQGDLKDIVFNDVSIEEGHAAAEMLLIGSTIKIVPVVEWDNRTIGTGRPGPIARKLLELWKQDIRNPSQLVEVPDLAG
jgi:4-amino-4-deoxychorismate lyase